MITSYKHASLFALVLFLCAGRAEASSSLTYSFEVMVNTYQQGFTHNQHSCPKAWIVGGGLWAEVTGALSIRWPLGLNSYSQSFCEYRGTLGNATPGATVASFYEFCPADVQPLSGWPKLVPAISRNVTLVDGQTAYVNFGAVGAHNDFASAEGFWDACYSF